MTTLAQRIHRFGPPGVIVLDEIPVPQPGPNEVLVRVAAAGVGPWDALVRTGRSGLEQPLPLTLGADLAGKVVAIGSGVTELRVGDDVFGVTNLRFVGAYAQHAVAAAGMICRKPPAVDFLAAGSLAVVAVTAWKMLFVYGHLNAGQRVLVHGAAGNVGSYAVQMARNAGATVIALAKRSDKECLQRLGASTVYDYADGPFADAIGPVDLVIDTVGESVQEQSFAALRPGGSLVSVVAVPDAARAARRGVRAEFFIVEVTTGDLERIGGMLASGAIVSEVGIVLPLSDARRAHELMASPVPRKRGKIVLSVDGAPHGYQEP